MMNRTDRLRRWFSFVLATAGLVTTVLVAGCATTSSTSNRASRGGVALEGVETRLRIGDQIQIRLELGGNQGPQVIETMIDENGEISLPLIRRIKAEGLTTSELVDRIQANYVPRYYIRCNATVIANVRFFYVGGEVRAPSRYNWSEDMSLLKAINTAGGFTDYANQRKVELTRGGQKNTFDCQDLRAHPNKDVALQPGDSVYVPRSIF